MATKYPRKKQPKRSVRPKVNIKTPKEPLFVGSAAIEFPRVHARAIWASQEEMKRLPTLFRSPRLLCISLVIATFASAAAGASSAEPDDVRRARVTSFKTFTVATVVESGPSTPQGATRIQPTATSKRTPPPSHHQVRAQPPPAAPSPGLIVRAPKLPEGRAGRQRGRVGKGVRSAFGS